MNLSTFTPDYFKRWHFLIVLILLLQLFARTHETLALTGYADESHHIRRAEVAWDFKTDGYASYIPGKLLLYYYLGLFETKRIYALLLSRLAVALITLLGGVGTYAVGRKLFNDYRIGVMSLFMYAVLPFTIFYDRMALADPLALAMMMLAVLGVLHWLQNPTTENAIRGGLLLILPPFAKLTAAGIVAAPILAVLVFAPRRWRDYLPSGAIMLGICGLAWFLLFIPSLVMLVREGNEKTVLVGDYLLNIHEEDQGFVANLADNIWEAVRQTAIYYWTPGLVLTLLCWLLLLYRRREVGLFLGGMVVLAWLPALVAGSEARARYLEIGLPFLLLILVGGMYELASMIQEYERRLTVERAIMIGFILYGIAWSLPFFHQAVTDPTQLDIPAADRWRYMQAVTAGYGQQDAVAFLEARARGNSRVEVYGILGSCHLMRLFMMETTTLNLTCAPLEDTRQLAPETIANIQTAARLSRGELYILLERDLESNFDDLSLQWTFVQAFPRPHNGVTLELWQVALAESDEGDYALPPRPEVNPSR